jgi:type IV secretion system protein VirD4
MPATKILWGQIFLVTTTALAGVWGATQWTAWRLGFQQPLGPPWFLIAGEPVYLPPSFFWWCSSTMLMRRESSATRVFVEGAVIASSGGVASIAIDFRLSVRRAREASGVTTQGSARWATSAEVRSAGLLNHDGAVLGGVSTPIICGTAVPNMPTRSGKGMGLVVPTLLTWPGSAIVTTSRAKTGI